jgi:hypothetical protein
MNRPEHVADAVATLIRYEIAKATQYHAGREFQIPSATRLQEALTRGGGRAVFDDSIHVKTWMLPPIVADSEHDDFFRAVVREEDNILDIDPDHLHALRRYVLNGDHGPFLRLFGGTLFLRNLSVA